MHSRNNKLYVGDIAAEKLAGRYGTPIYVYDRALIEARCRAMRKSFPKARICYACKANTNPAVLTVIKRHGIGIETVSRGELDVALRCGFKPHEISFTCSNVEKDELLYALKRGVTIHADSLGQLETIGIARPGSRVSLRVNQGIGAGHHSHVVTGGRKSKFGIPVSKLRDAKRIAEKHDCTITGLQQHIGSNVLDPRVLLKAMEALLKTARQFPNLEHLDFGGGFGIPYRPGEQPPDIRALGKEMTSRFAVFAKEYGRRLTMSIEPGRYLVAESGILLVKGTDVKRNPGRIFVGVNSGFNHLIRPAMYGSFHEIVNASRVNGRKERVTVAGNVCESGDVFAKNRTLTACKEGDTLAILNAGAYGYSMASHYNSRPLPAEVLVSGKSAKLIRKPLMAKS